ncbi:MAG: proton-conducting transporter membrane subunit, partial [Planctomycetota bacterium]
MPAVAQILLAILAPAAFGLATLPMPQRSSWTPARVAVALCGPIASFFLILGVLLGGGLSHPATGVWPWLPTLEINLAFFTDGLGGFFGLLVAGVGALIVLYARGYFGRQGPTSSNDLYRFYPMLGFFMTAMLGVVLSDYTLLTLLFWEMTSISSFFLIGWNRDDKHAVKLAMQAFFTTGLGGLMLFGGLLLLGNNTGLWRWSELIPAAAGVGEVAIDWTSPRLGWAFGLIFIGAASKSAQWPLHYWLPGAMAAPTPVSAFLHSATMVKAGVFLIGRLLPIFGQHDLWAGIIVPFGAVTMLYGGVFAVMQHDLKRIFAYTTVSQLGLLMAMYGLGGLTYEYKGEAYANIDYAVSQIANHAFYKAPLFIAAGAIGHVASRKLPELFGAFHKHKMICLTMLLAGYGLAAGPGTISFQAKELFLYAIVHGAKEHPLLWLVLVMTVLTAACNVAIFVRLLTTLMGWKTGLGAGNHAPEQDHDHAQGHDDHHHEHGVMASMIWLPGLLLVSLQYVGGLFPGLIWTPVFKGLDGATASNYIYKAYEGQIPNLWQVLTHPGLPLLASIVAIGLGVALGLSRLMRGEVTDINDRVYPSVYTLCVDGGGVLFRAFQNGRFTHYVLISLGAALVGFWGIAPKESGMLAGLDVGAVFEHPVLLLLGVMVCFTALAIP